MFVLLLSSSGGSDFVLGLDDVAIVCTGGVPDEQHLAALAVRAARVSNAMGQKNRRCLENLS